MGNMSSRKLFFEAYCFLSAFFSASPKGTPNLAAGLRFHLELWKGVEACADSGSLGSSSSLPPMPSRPSWGSLGRRGRAGGLVRSSDTEDAEEGKSRTNRGGTLLVFFEMRKG